MVQLVDDRAVASGGEPLNFFMMSVVLAYAAFADAPVDVAVVEVGLGGTWDATNVADGQVAVVTPVAIDHAQLLGSTVGGDRHREVGHHQARRRSPSPRIQERDVAEILLERANEVGRADPVRGQRLRGHRSRGGARWPAAVAARDRRGVPRHLPAPARRAPGQQRRDRPGRGGGVPRRRRAAARPRHRAAGRSPTSPRPVGWRSSAGRRRCSSTRRTTRPVCVRSGPRWATPSRSPSWSGSSAIFADKERRRDARDPRTGHRPRRHHAEHVAPRPCRRASWAGSRPRSSARTA